MSTLQIQPSEIRVPLAQVHPPANDARRFVRRGAAFVLIGLLVYAGLYVLAESLVRDHARRNRFFVVQTAPHVDYDHVILGASHAAVFDYRDMNERLEALTGDRILNLANVGAGVKVNRLLLDYFLVHRNTRSVVYVLDSFAFYSTEWNEERLKDTKLYVRAPWDSRLARLLLSRPETRLPGLAYISGFPKINDSARFEPDLFPGEGSTFDRTYRPIAQLDRQRLEYLYPPNLTSESLERSPYLADFEELARELRVRGIQLTVVRPPIPDRIHAMIPFEAEFDRILRALVERNGGVYHDLALVANDPAFFYDSDHLNRTGVLNFFEHHLAEILTHATSARSVPASTTSAIPSANVRTGS